MTDDIAATAPLDLDKAQALADAATPGPWATDGDYDRAEVSQTVEPYATIVGTETTGRTYLSYEQLVLTAADSAFIAQARTLVPALIAELRPNRDHWKVRAETAEIESARLKDTIDRVRKLAKEWAEQPTDYDEDTEQQIDDGNIILATLKDGAR
jgi:hypothetical protein